VVSSLEAQQATQYASTHVALQPSRVSAEVFIMCNGGGGGGAAAAPGSSLRAAQVDHQTAQLRPAQQQQQESAQQQEITALEDQQAAGQQQRNVLRQLQPYILKTSTIATDHEVPAMAVQQLAATLGAHAADKVGSLLRQGLASMVHSAACKVTGHCW
jgi:hypothetical protein